MRKVSVCVLSVSSSATSHDDSSDDEATLVNYDGESSILQHQITRPYKQESLYSVLNTAMCLFPDDMNQ